MKIATLGLGYVGLVTSACLAELGNEVLGIDINPNRIKLLNDGEMPIYEPGLRELVLKNVAEGRLSFADSVSKKIDDCKMIFIAVGTPQETNGKPDITAVYKSLDLVAPFIKSHKIIVLKSTVPIGTNEAVEKYLKDKISCDFDIVSNPEFLKEGSAVNDFMKPDRIVIGTNNIKVGEIMKDLYSNFTKNGHPMLVMDPVSAETVKYVSNTMLALKVSFINEVARLCDVIGADIRRVREGVITDPRIGSKFLYPSIGYGGSCLPKDVQALSYSIEKLGLNLLIPKAIEESNRMHVEWFSEKILNYYGKDIKNKTITVWGTAFKAGTDDIRESPAIKLIEELSKTGVKLKIYDPIALENTKSYFTKTQNLTFTKSEKESIENSDALLLCTEWLQFRNPDFEMLAANLKDKVIFDGRNIYGSEKLKLYGLTHIGIGTKSTASKEKSKNNS